MKRKRVGRTGSNYQVTVRWRPKAMKRLGLVVPPGHTVAIELGTASCTFTNNGIFTYAHLMVKKDVRREEDSCQT